MKKVGYVLIFMVGLFLFTFSVNAQEIVANGEWVNVDMQPFSFRELMGYNAEYGENGVCQSTYSPDIQAKAVKTGDKWICMVKGIKTGKFDIEYGFLDEGGNPVLKGTTYITVVKSKKEEEPSSGHKEHEIRTDFLQICDVNENPQIVASTKLIGIFINIIKILVPIIMIVLGSIDMTKAVLSKEQDAIQKQLFVLIRRIIIGSLVFLAPSIINSAFHLIDGMDNYESAFSTCMDCILGSDSCPNVSFINN